MHLDEKQQRTDSLGNFTANRQLIIVWSHLWAIPTQQLSGE